MCSSADTRNGAADHVESQVLQRFEADATLESPAVCSAIRYGPMSSFLPLFLYSLMNYDRQDYFGRTVNIASRFQGLATSRSIFATRRVVTDSEASKLLQSNGIAATPEKRSLRGIAKQVEIFEIP